MKEVQRKRLVQAVHCLTPRLQAAILALDGETQARCEEVRLRAGQPIQIQCGGAERSLSAPIPDAEELREIVSRAARYSVHSYAEALAQGYLPLEGGHRLGVCGSAVVKGREIGGIRTFSSLNLRVARQQPGAGEPILPQLMQGGRLRSTLILSPPGYGKTTILRDLIRLLSGQGVRVAVADERGELAAMHDGVPQFDVGAHTDVLEGCPKAQGTLMLLKTMSPAVVALDEVTSPEDVEAIGFAGHCGVSILATAHAFDREDLCRRPLYRELLALSVFDRIVTIQKQGLNRIYQVEHIGGGTHA